MAAMADGLKIWSAEMESEERADGSILVWQKGELGAYPRLITDRLVEHAAGSPHRTWLAQRGADGNWREVSYAQALQAARSIGQFLLDAGLSAERPLVILSENSIEHALMAIGAQFVGIPSAALSTAYSLIASDFGKLEDIAGQLTPGMVFAQDGAKFAKAIADVFPAIPVVVERNAIEGRACFRFADIVATPVTPAVDAAHAAAGPDTVLKFLFTSGTTGSPKAVIQTNRMVASNQAMVRDCFAFMEDEPPVVVDWAPWSHTASGNKVFYMVLNNGGSYYIDAGKPAPGAIDVTIANLKDVAPTWYFNVPAGFDMLVHAMENDEQLRDNFFSRLRMIMYAGAGIAQHTWDMLGQLSIASTGRKVLLSTGLGATETGPFQMQCMETMEKAGNIGLPAKGVVLKLVPNEGKLEARLKSPSITPGYWRNPKLTAEAFDEEGFYKLGDALKFAVPGDASKGFLFDGRIAENFKLVTGTWVAVGEVRAKLVNAFGGLVKDAAMAGENREFLSAIVFANHAALEAVAGRAGDIASLMQDEKVVAALGEKLEGHRRQSTGSASRVDRIIVALEPPSLEKGEITDKGSINQRAVLRHRPNLVSRLYSDASGRVLAG